MRVAARPEDLEFDEEELAALAILNGPLNKQDLNEVLLDGAPELRRRGFEYGDGDGSQLAPAPFFLSPITALGLNIMALGPMKAQAKGRMSRKAHEWCDLVLCFDLYPHGEWSTMFIAAHVPLAVAAGIRVEAIEALRDGREDDLEPEEIRRIQFIRAVYRGEMTDEAWASMVALEGSEQGVVEHVSLILLMHAHIRAYQAFGIPGNFTQRELASMLEQLKTGERPPADIEAYERYFASVSWQDDRQASTE